MLNLPSVHKCTEKGKFTKICYIRHHFEYPTDPLYWERSVTFTLFFSKLLKLFKMMLCSVFSFNPKVCKPQTLLYSYFILVTVN